MLPPRASRADIEAYQVARLASLVAEVGQHNRFWQAKWGSSPFAIESLGDLERLPLTTKAELIADQDREPPYGTNLTYPPETYTRLHQTSGTKGKPLRWLDTPESWESMLGCWRQIFAMAGVGRGSRVFFPFSFGPFLGFWTAFEAAASIGCLVIPAGGLSTGARLNVLIENEATVLCCTPTYALHLAQAAHHRGLGVGRLPRGVCDQGRRLAGR